MRTLYEVKYAVTDKWLQECNAYQRMFSGISLSPEQMLEVFLTDERCLIASITVAFETGEREWFQDLLAKKLLGHDWPCGADSNEPLYENFSERLTEAAIKEGYNVEG